MVISGVVASPSEMDTPTAGSPMHHGLGGDGAVCDLLDLTIENVHGGLCANNEIAHDHSDGNDDSGIFIGS